MEDNTTRTLTGSKEEFFRFVRECNERFRPSHSLESYKELIEMHREVNHLGTLLEDEEFHAKLFSTLKDWNMNRRGARLEDRDTMRRSILANKPFLVQLSRHKLEMIESINEKTGQEVVGLLEFVFSHLQVMQSKRRIVGVSKAMHLLLPDLVMPIDSTYTIPLLLGRTVSSPDLRKEFEFFREIFAKAHYIVRKLGLNKDDVDGNRWNTSVPKLVDNALIGLFKCITDSV